MFGDELRQLMQRDVCSHHPQQNALVLLHEEIHTHTHTDLDQNSRNSLPSFFFFFLTVSFFVLNTGMATVVVRLGPALSFNWKKRERERHQWFKLVLHIWKKNILYMFLFGDICKF